MKVTISSGSGRFYLYHAGAIACENSILLNFLTGFYITHQWQRSFFSTKLALLVLGKSKSQKALLREETHLDSSLVKSFSLPEIISSFSGKTAKISKNFREIGSHLSHLLFGLQSVPYVNECNIFHVRSCFGRYCMAKAKDNGAICLVDHTIAHPNYLTKVSQEESHYWEQKADWQPGRPFWKTCLEDLNEADYITTNSEFAKQTIVDHAQFDPEKIFVIPMGVNPDQFNSFVDQDKKAPEVGIKFKFLYAGSLSFRKGILYLLEAWTRLNLPEAELIVIGSVSNEVRPLLSRYEFDSIKFLSHVPYSELNKIYSSANVFVFPSLAEGSALVTYEAMACGLPILTTFNSGSVMRDGIDGWLVPPKDVEALMKKLLWFYENQAVAIEMGVNASKNILQNYTWNNYQERIISLYYSLYSKSEKS